MLARRVRLALPIAAALLSGSAAAQASLPDLRGARAILVNDWRGSDGSGPRMLVAYNIERQDAEGFYAGLVNFVVAPGTKAERTSSGLVAVPPEVASGFLAALSAVPVAAAPAPSAPGPEGAPLYVLVVEAGDQAVEFRADAHADQRRPWRIRTRGPAGERAMAGDADAVWRALRILDPHLKRDWVEARRREAAGAR